MAPARPGRVYVLHRPGCKWCKSPEGAPPPGSGFVTTPAHHPGEIVHHPGRKWCGKPLLLQIVTLWERFIYMSKGARILPGIRLNAIYGVFGIGGICGGESAMRGRKMPERRAKWREIRKFRYK